METSASSFDTKNPKGYYAHLGQVECRLRKQLRAAKRRNDEEKAALCWQKILDIKQKRSGSVHGLALAKMG